nr:hypothetical protein CFP56_20256 [Quercus suber]
MKAVKKEIGRTIFVGRLIDYTYVTGRPRLEQVEERKNRDDLSGPHVIALDFRIQPTSLAIGQIISCACYDHYTSKSGPYCPETPLRLLLRTNCMCIWDPCKVRCSMVNNMHGDTNVTNDALMPMDYSLLDDDDSTSCQPLSKHDAALERAVMEHVHGSSSSLFAWQQALGSDNDGDGPPDDDRGHTKPANVARRRRRALKAAMEAEDDRLDDELSDWHIDEAS